MMAHVKMGPGNAAAAAAPVIKLFGAVIHDRPPKEEEDDDDESPAAAAAAPPPAAATVASSASAEAAEGRGGAAAAAVAAAASAPLPCPRCRSRETKFCYFNNYNVNQPRHFCKSCRRYWTAGGALRNVPVGAGRRKARPLPPHHIAAAAADRWIAHPDPPARPSSAAPPPLRLTIKSLTPRRSKY